MHILHKWSEWSKMFNTYDKTKQARHCEICNKAQMRDVGYSYETNIAVVNFEPREIP